MGELLPLLLGSLEQTLTVDHLWCHPVGVAHHCVPLLAVGLLEVAQVFRLTLLIYHESSQPKVGHHHVLVLEIS